MPLCMCCVSIFLEHILGACLIDRDRRLDYKPVAFECFGWLVGWLGIAYQLDNVQNLG